MGDNSADDGSLPVIVSANQSASAIVQFQCWILQWIGNSVLTELRANGANNHPLWLSALNNEPANHYVVARLHKCASGDVTEPRRRCWRCSGGRRTRDCCSRRRSCRRRSCWCRCQCRTSCSCRCWCPTAGFRVLLVVISRTAGAKVAGDGVEGLGGGCPFEVIAGLYHI